MIHAVYVRNKPKSMWALMTVANTAQLALQDKKMFLEEAIKNGNAEAETAIKTFNSIWFIPEYLNEIVEEPKLLFN